MKHLLILGAFILAASVTDAQTTTNSGTQKSKSTTNTRKTTRAARGTGQYYGSKDTTPGSPMGTGGAGGSDMSGSQKGSAMETAEKQSTQQMGSEGSHTKKAAARSKSKHKKNLQM